MTVIRLVYLDNVAGAAGRPGRAVPSGVPLAPIGLEPPFRDLERSDIIRFSGAGWGDTVLPLAAEGEPGFEADQAMFRLDARERRIAAWGAAAPGAPVGSAAWTAKIDAFAASCVATGHWTAVESDDRVDCPGGL